MKNPATVLTVVPILVALTFVAPGLIEAAPVVIQLDPFYGMVGHEVRLRGKRLVGKDVEVLFGRARAAGFQSAPGTDGIIRVLVPNKVDPDDPDLVEVTVFVNGVEAAHPGAPLMFNYIFPQPAPEITDYMTGDPSSPKHVAPYEPFVLTLTGSNFLLSQRVPQRCIASGLVRLEADVLAGSSSDSSVGCFFPGLDIPGDYDLWIAFSDGSGASIPAPEFVSDRRIFGHPPNIQSVLFETNPQEVVECDFAEIVEKYLCTFGVIGATADPGVFIGGAFTHVRVQASVTDPESTPQQSNILLVAASFIHPESGGETSFVLFDDGSANKFPFFQKATVPEDCSEIGFGLCECSPKVYPITTGDAVAVDSLFTRDLAFLDRTTIPSGLLQDCIMQQFHDVPMDFLVGATLQFTIEAIDRQGNKVAWPLMPTSTIGTGAFSCTGDECGCCLLTSANSAVDCKGKPGMPSTDFPLGVCQSAF